MSFIAGIGKTNVDLLYADMKKLPDVGEEVYTDKFMLQLGGGLPATLMNLARLGVPVKLATYLGDDIFSEFAKQEYRNSHTEFVNFHNGSTIPVNITSAVILPEDRSFISYGIPKTAFSNEEKNRFYQMAKGCSFCYIENPALAEVYHELKKEGAVLVHDTGWDENLSVENYKEMLMLADYYVPNQKEAMKITGAPTPLKAAEALRQYFDKVVIKLDKDGCLGVDEAGTVFTVKAIGDFHCVDSTGAGDAFLAGFLYGLYHRFSFRDCILAGNITGGKAVTAVGALSAYCSESELLQQLKCHQ